MRPILLICLALVTLQAWGQAPDSSRLLQEVIIHAYATDKPLNEVPASVAYVSSEDLQRFSNTNLLPAVNLIPGVRMEERSPGSYRFSIRGSLLRSPFGVRNVKVYWNDLPFTDGGGNTYLNLFDFNSIGSLEIIKGPGGSLYGAGTGGVLLLSGPPVKESEVLVSGLAGNYGLTRFLLGGKLKQEKVEGTLYLSDQRSDGYREQTAMERTAVHSDLRFRLHPKSTIATTLLFSDLYYQTPGGLTLTQFRDDPQQARPAAGPNPGAVDARAAVFNRTFYGGLSHLYQWNSNWFSKTGVYFGSSDFKNPSIRNVEERREKNVGIRSQHEYSWRQERTSGKITFGGEFQFMDSPIDVYNNDRGNKTTVQTRDDIDSRLTTLFAQTDLSFPADITVSAGASLTFPVYNFSRTEPQPPIRHERIFDAVFSPRLALIKKWNDGFSVYSSYSYGFSPPSLAEVRPSTNTFNNDLRPENGRNLELGIKGSSARWEYDLGVYDLQMTNTIVIQRLPDNAEYFVNAGQTSQRGIEARGAITLLADNQKSISFLKVWASYTYQHYRFKNYVNDDNDFSGNKLTGVAPTVFSGGMDVVAKRIFYMNLTLNYVDHIPLNDANTAFAPAYTLAGMRTGVRIDFDKGRQLEIFLGVDNALDKTYSLGNDLNAFGGRYYNAAMPRNYYGGVQWRWAK